jgi:TetR/AcrR family transcriptional regulator, tetracycline repressor protein
MRLDRERVIRSALGLLNKVGLERLTLRRIARELSVQAPALYWHFKNKQELLDEMATMMFKDLLTGERPFSSDGPWAESMARSMRALRRMLLGYRDGAKVFGGTYLTDDTLLESMELPLRKLTDAGFSIRDAVCSWTTVYSYTIGFVIEEQTVYLRPGERDKRYDPSRRARRIDAKKFPLALAAGKQAFGNFDQNFENGLQMILSGIEQSLQRK